MKKLIASYELKDGTVVELRHLKEQKVSITFFLADNNGIKGRELAPIIMDYEDVLDFSNLVRNFIPYDERNAIDSKRSKKVG